MKTTKILTFTLITSTLLLLNGCGGGGSGGETSIPTGSSNAIVPQKININIPNGLKNNRNAAPAQKQTFQKVSQKTSDTIPSRGYQQLKTTVDEVERTIQEVKEDMVITNAMMPDIQTECEGTAINEVCTIPAGVISLTITNSIIADLTAVQNEFGTVDPASLPPVNFVLTMGQVHYTQFDNSHLYQQDIVLDLQPTFAALGIEITKELETIRWSGDKNSIETISDIDDAEGKYTMHLTYNQVPNGITNMNVTQSYSLGTGATAVQGNFSFDMKETHDAVNTIIVDVSGANTSNGYTDTFKENGELTDNGGFLVSKGSFADSEFAEKETFDKEGNLLQSKYCDSFDLAETCVISDETTWHTFDEILGIDDDTFEEQVFDENDFGEEADYVFKTQELTVTGGTLSDGICDLLPPSFNTANISQGEGIFENSVGNIFKFESDVEAFLFNTTYIDQLDALKVVCFNGETAEFVELRGADRPTLTQVSNDGE